MVAALALPLSFPVGPQPLMSLPRFLAVLFPIFMWLALVVRGAPRARHAWRPLSASGSACFTAQFATWHSSHEPRAVLLDALGTLVELQPPAPRLRRLLARRPASTWRGARRSAGSAPRSPTTWTHHIEGGDPEALDDLRDRCAERDARGARRSPGLDRATARRAMLGALEFTPFPDAAPALRELRARGLRAGGGQQLGLLPARVAPRPGLLDLVDGVVSSAVVGAAKPDAGAVPARARAGRRASRATRPRGRLARERPGGRARGGHARRARGPRRTQRPREYATVRSLAELASLV